MADERIFTLDDINGNLVDYYFIIDKNNLQKAQKIKGLDLISYINQSTSKQKAYYYTGQLTNGQVPINGWNNGDFVYSQDVNKIYHWQVLNNVVNLVFSWDKTIIGELLWQGTYDGSTELTNAGTPLPTLPDQQYNKWSYYVNVDGVVNGGVISDTDPTPQPEQEVKKGDTIASNGYHWVVLKRAVETPPQKFIQYTGEITEGMPAPTNANNGDYLYQVNTSTQSSLVGNEVAIGMVVDGFVSLQVSDFLPSNGNLKIDEYNREVATPQGGVLVSTTFAGTIIDCSDVTGSDINVNLDTGSFNNIETTTTNVIGYLVFNGISVVNVNFTDNANSNYIIEENFNPQFDLTNNQLVVLRYTAIPLGGITKYFIERLDDINNKPISTKDVEQDERISELERGALPNKSAITWDNTSPITINGLSNTTSRIYVVNVTEPGHILDVTLDVTGLNVSKNVSGEFIIYKSGTSTAIVGFNFNVIGAANYTCINQPPATLPYTTTGGNGQMLIRYSQNNDSLMVEFVYSLSEPICSHQEAHRFFNSSDFNDYTKAGSCSGNTDTLNLDGLGTSYINGPVGVNFFNIEITENITGSSSVFLTQKLTDIVTGDIFFRSRSNTTWTEWVEVITDKNIGNYSHIKGYKVIPSTTSYNLNVYTEIAGRFKITASGNFTLNAIGTLAQMNENANISQCFEFLIYNNSSGNISVSLNTSGMSGFGSVLKYLEVPANSNFNKNIPSGSYGKFIVTFNPNGSGVVITGEGGQIFSLI